MLRKKKKGIVGIEAAIVLIAFVIVAAALAFVVLNMGFYTTQKSKEVMSAGLGEASSSIELAGSVIGKLDATAKKYLEYIFIPLKLAQGKEPVDFGSDKLSVSAIFADQSGTSKSFANIYEGINTSRVIDDLGSYSLSGTVAVANYTITIDGNTIDELVEYGEQVWLVVHIDTTSIQLSEYSKVMVEIRPSQGAPLTVKVSVPPLTGEEYVVLG